jgi:hypothetical protein
MQIISQAVSSDFSTKNPSCISYSSCVLHVPPLSSTFTLSS